MAAAVDNGEDVRQWRGPVGIQSGNRRATMLNGGGGGGSGGGNSDINSSVAATVTELKRQQ